MPFMTHPKHGATHCNSADVAANEAAGWKVSTYDEWLAPKRGRPAKADDANEADQPEKPKRGRPAKADDANEADQPEKPKRGRPAKAQIEAE